MKRGEKRLFFSVIAIFVVAVVLLITQHIWGGNGPKVYRVSVLLDGSDGDYWKNFRAGLSQAALERNVDLRFVTRYDNPRGGQADALRREWVGEAEGVILLPADPYRLDDALKEAPDRLAVCVVGPKLELGNVDCYISPDYAVAGRKLADASTEIGSVCTLYLSDRPGTAATLLAEGLEAALAERGIPCERRTVGEGPLVLPPKGALVAVEPAVANFLCEVPAATGRVVAAGVDQGLLRALEKGTAVALVVQSDFDAGYLALSATVSKLAGEKTGDAVLESYTATGVNMFQYPMSDILFSAY